MERVSLPVTVLLPGILAALQGFEFFEGAGPVGAQQAREAAIREDFSGGLAAGTVVGFVVGVANALDSFSTSEAGLAVAAMDLHIWAKGGHFFGKGGGRFCAETIDPELNGIAGGGVQSFPFLWLQLVSLGDGRELRSVQNLIGIGVADTAEDARVGQRTLERAIFGCQC